MNGTPPISRSERPIEARRAGDRLFPAHRLDRETSGVLLLSRTPEADRRVKVQFEARSTVEKRYLAISWGRIDWRSRLLDLPMMLDPDAKYKVKMRVAAAGEDLSAATECALISTRTHPTTGRPYSMIRCTLLTGRQHQIRLHLSAARLPIVGDKLYGPDDGLFARGVDGELTDEDRALLELPRHALHAAELSLDHPITGACLCLSAPLPEDLRAFWDSLSSGRHASGGLDELASMDSPRRDEGHGGFTEDFLSQTLGQENLGETSVLSVPPW